MERARLAQLHHRLEVDIASMEAHVRVLHELRKRQVVPATQGFSIGSAAEVLDASLAPQTPVGRVRGEDFVHVSRQHPGVRFSDEDDLEGCVHEGLSVSVLG